MARPDEVHGFEPGTIIEVNDDRWFAIDGGEWLKYSPNTFVTVKEADVPDEVWVALASRALLS